MQCAHNQVVPAGIVTAKEARVARQAMLAAASRMKCSSAYGAEQDRNDLLDFGPMRRLCPNAFTARY
jgi:hypothetical protein